MDAQERVARILCRLMGDEWQQGERLYRNTADEIIATLSPASNVAPREAGIQAFYADESTTNTLQGLNAAFDAYEAAAKPARDELVKALRTATRAAKLALFVIRKQDVMPNSSWESGFNSDIAVADAALSIAKAEA